MADGLVRWPGPKPTSGATLLLLLLLLGNCAPG